MFINIIISIPLLIINVGNKVLVSDSDYDFWRKTLTPTALTNETLLRETLKHVNEIENPMLRAFIAKGIAQALPQLASNPNLLNIASEILSDLLGTGVTFKNNSIKGYTYLSWYTRATAAYHIGRQAKYIVKAGNINYIVKTLMLLMKYDIEERVRGISAIALSRIANALGTSIKGTFANRDFIMLNIIMMIDKVPTTMNFWAWALVKAISITPDPRAYYHLLAMRKRGFNLKVKDEINKAIGSIVSLR